MLVNNVENVENKGRSLLQMVKAFALEQPQMVQLKRTTAS